MELKFDVSTRIARPVSEVFEAIVNPEKLSEYFTTGGAKGRLETGATVMWDFHDFPGAFPVEVVEVETDRRIILKWDSEKPKEMGGDGTKYRTTVTFTFEPLDGDRTLLTIREEGWPETPIGLDLSYLNCMGWAQMACALKAWLEHGVNLRRGMYD